MRLDLCTWPEVEAHLGRTRGIILPLGATEQHGPTGLIGTDALCAEAVARGVGEQLDVLVGPTLTLGASQFNLAFPGTISLRATTLMALLADVVTSLASQGFRDFYLLNGHGGNIAPCRAAAHDLAAHPLTGGPPLGGVRLRLRSWWELQRVQALRAELYGQLEGMHATPSEVAITQHLHPGRVQVGDEAGALTRPEPLSAMYLRDHAGDQHGEAAAHRAHFPDGRVGSDPSLATPADGQRLLALAIADAAADYQAFVAEGA
jgi:creatinine amidohydrolase